MVHDPSVPPRAFISYARSDGEPFATALRTRLEREHPEIALWQDRARMEGGVGWWKQITDALEQVQVLIMVMTPAAGVSETARKEWRYARQQGARICPVIGEPGFDFAALPSWMRKAHFYDLSREWDAFVAFLRGTQKSSRVPFMAPDLREGYVARGAEFQVLADHLLTRHGAEPVSATAALQGAGGFGKTTLATALCHHDEVISAFDDGILWATLGHRPNVLLELTKLYAAFTGERPPFVDIEDAAINLASRLEDKNCLLVIDDAWNVHDVEPFLRGGRRCARLVTTRQLEVVTELRASRVLVSEMTEAESLQLLRAALPAAPGSSEPLRPLARRLGDWPLLLRLAGSQLRSRIQRGDSLEGALAFVHRALDRRGTVAFDRTSSASRHDAVATTVGVSLDLLPDADRRRCTELSIFPGDRAIPASAVQALWQLDEFETEAVLERLDAASLLEFDLKTASIRLHDVFRSFLGSLLDNPAPVHARLVRQGWRDPYALPDAHAWRWYAWHVARSGDLDGLQRLLFDPEWMRRKIRATDVHALVDDYDFLHPDPAARLLQDAVRLAAAALSRYPDQLPVQLAARLPAGHIAAIDEVVSAAARTLRHPCLALLHPSLTPPGGPLIAILKAHAQSVDDLALSADGEWVLSGSRDWRLRLWHLRTGHVERTLDNHAPVTCVAFMPDGSRAVSGSEDRRVCLWTLESGTVAAEHRQHAGTVHRVAIAPDGQSVYSISEDGSLLMWLLPPNRVVRLLRCPSHRMHGLAVAADGRMLVFGTGDAAIAAFDIETRSIVRTFAHAGVVRGVALSADGRHLASGAEDKLVRVWDMTTGELVHVLEGHTHFIHAVAFTPDGGLLVSGGADTSMCVWDVQTGQLLETLEGHSGSVRAVAAHPDGRRMISASGDQTIRVWGLGTGPATRGARPHASAVSVLAISSDGRCAVSAAEGFGALRVWDSARDRPVGTLEGHDGSVFALAMSADGTRLLTGGADHTLRLWDLASGRTLHVLKGHTSRVFMTLMTPDASRAISLSRDRTMRVWDLTTGRAVLAARRAHGRTAPSALLDLDTGRVLDILRAPISRESLVALSADGRRLVFTSGSALILWDLESGSTRATDVGDFDPVAMAADPACRTVLLGSRFGSVAICDASDEITVRVLQGHADTVRDAAIAGNNRGVTASRTALRTWDLPGAREIQVRNGVWNNADGVAISPAGEIAYGILGDTVAAVSVGDGVELGTLSLDHNVTTVAVAADDRMLAVGDASGRVHFLRVEC